MKKNKSDRKRSQAPKPLTGGRNEDWMRAELAQANRNLTRPGKNHYKRAKAGARGRDW